MALRNILGPRDELVESVPLEQAKLLVAEVDSTGFGEDIGYLIETDTALVFSALETNPSAMRILTDGGGQFSAPLDPGGYVFCVSFAPPWASFSQSQQCKELAISKAETTRVSVTYSPMAGLFVLNNR